jgi:hypothetical protein
MYGGHREAGGTATPRFKCTLRAWIRRPRDLSERPYKRPEGENTFVNAYCLQLQPYVDHWYNVLRIIIPSSWHIQRREISSQLDWPTLNSEQAHRVPCALVPWDRSSIRRVGSLHTPKLLELRELDECWSTLVATAMGAFAGSARRSLQLAPVGRRACTLYSWPRPTMHVVDGRTRLVCRIPRSIVFGKIN